MRAFCAIVRVGAIGCLILAALLLVVDASEYAQLSRAGIRVLVTDILPLLILGVLNLRALDPERHQRLHVALVGNVLVLAGFVPLLRAGAPALPWLLSGVSTLLVIGSLGCAATCARVRRREIE